MAKNSISAFKWQPFSVKQKKLLSWWTPKSPYRDYDMIIATGSIRSGKTVAMIDSFVTWSQTFFSNQVFIIAGKSIGSLKRNVLKPMFQILSAKGISYRYNRSGSVITVGTNEYHCFGANNERSQDTLQGLTAAGALADELALMPWSFIDQMIGRCSVDGSKIFANCNPEGPFHPVKVELIDKAKEKRILVLHFTLDDNLSLAQRIKDRYKRMFTGVFYQRYILGLWVMAEGVIYSGFDHTQHVVNKLPDMRQHWVGVDYGTSNATTFLLMGHGVDNKLYVCSEYYHSGSQSGVQKSPAQYSKEFKAWLEKQTTNTGALVKPEAIYIDPSAEGFIVQLWSDGVKGIVKADNEVKRGIELVSSIISGDQLRVHSSCKNTLKEFSAYAWDPKAQEKGEDKPLKASDHCLDPIRYTANATRKLWQARKVG